MKRLSFASILVIGILVLAACSGGGNSSSGTVTPGSSASTSAAVTGTQVSGSLGTSAAPAGGEATSSVGGATTSTQSGVGTAVSGTSVVGGASSTSAVSATASPSVVGTQTGGIGLPVTGSTVDMLRVTDLMGYTVQDNAGQMIGNIQDLVVDLRNAAVCGSVNNTTGTNSSTTTGSTPAVGMTTSTAAASTPATSVGTGMNVNSCGPTAANNPQQNGLIAYVIVNASNMTNSSSSSSASGTAVASPTVTSTSSYGSSSSSSMNSSYLPVPWNAVQINVNQRVLVVNKSISDLSSAPNFTGSATWPDFFSTDWTARLNSYWGNVSGGTTGGYTTPSNTPTP